MNTKIFGFLGLVTIVAFGIVWLALAPLKQANAQQENKGKCILYAPEGYPDKTNCPECIKDNGDKRERERFRAAGTITKDFSKNLYYIQPPVPLGEGHALKVDLTAPGNIVAVSRGCYGEGCGWTHDVTYQNMGAKTVTWIGWSNSGANCILTFTITYQ